MVEIKDGTGTGRKMGINEDNQALVSAVTDTRDHYVNHNDGKYFAVSISQQASAAGSCILYVKNLDDEDLCINTVGFSCDVDTIITIKLNDYGTPFNATTVVPVNFNAGSGNLADGDFYHGGNLCESGTGLAGGDTLLSYSFVGGTGSQVVNIAPSIILPKNTTLTVYVDQATTVVGLGLGFNYHGVE